MCLAVPGRVETLFEENGTLMGKVNFGGVVKNVCLVYLPDIKVGDYALVHVGFAISQIDESAALETLRTFERLGLLEEELAELGNPDKTGTDWPDETAEPTSGNDVAWDR